MNVVRPWRAFSPFFALVILLCLIQPAVGWDQPNEGDSSADEAAFASTWSQLDTAATALLNQHLTPPTRQQMMLSACRGFFKATKKRPPVDISQQFSSVASADELKGLMFKHWQKQVLTGKAHKNSILRNGMMAMLADCDQAINYVDMKEHRVRKQLSENQYVGIGIRLSRTPAGWPRIDEAMYGGAAQKGGAGAGDLIVKVDGAVTKDLEFREVIDLLRGEKHSEVEVSLRHEDETEVRDVLMTRNVVPFSTVKGITQNQSDGSWDVQFPEMKGVAYLTFDSIVGSTAAELKALARKIRKSEFRACVLDFRNCGQAIDIHHAIMMVDMLNDGDKVFDLITRQSIRPVSSGENTIFDDLPLYVLAKDKVSGPCFAVLAALRADKKNVFVGSPIQSDGLCRKSIELDNGLGALGGMAYGLVMPSEPFLAQNAEGAGAGVVGANADGSMLLLKPDVIVTGDAMIEVRKLLRDLGGTQF